MPKFKNGETSIPDYRKALLRQALVRAAEPDSLKLKRENLINWLLVKALPLAANSNKVLPNRLKLHPCNLTGRPNSDGYHRVGWENLIKGFDRLGFELVFEVREKQQATRDAAGASVPQGK